jgi:hypothetical protein
VANQVGVDQRVGDPTGDGLGRANGLEDRPAAGGQAVGREYGHLSLLE